MITQEQQKLGAEIINTLAQKAWESSTFKEQLINNPVSTIESVIGRNFTMPDNTRLIVEDQTDSSIIYFNIPSQPNSDSIELSAEQLETVSGGSTPLCVIGAGMLAMSAFEAICCVGVGAAIYQAVK